MAELAPWEDPATVIPGGRFVDREDNGRTPLTARTLNAIVDGMRNVRSSMAAMIGELDQVSTDLGATMAAYVPKTRRVIAGDGLTGGGALDADRTLTVSYGTAAGTAAQGNDTRIVNSVQKPSGLALGDLLVGAAGGLVSRLAKSSDGYVLKLVSGLPSWQPEGAGSVAWVEAPLNTTYFGWYTDETNAHRLAYSKVGDRVHIQGEWRCVTSPGAVATLFTLPPDMRPSKPMPILGTIGTSSTTPTNTATRTVYAFTVNPDGTVKTANMSATHVGSLNTSFPLR